MTDQENPLGTLVTLADGRQALRYVRHYRHPPQRVWSALVEPDALAAWFPARVEGERQEGAPLRFVFEGEEGPVLEGVVRVFDPPSLLEYTWAEDVLRFELTPTGAGGMHCRLVFTTTFGQRSHAARDASGWHMCLTNLGNQLSATPQGAVQAQFPALYEAYVSSLGLGDFPSFLRGASSDVLAELLPADHLEGKPFTDSSGRAVAMIRAPEETAIREHTLPDEGAYLYVVEGACTLQLGAHELLVSAGTEFHVPGGGKLRGKLSQGTRLIYGRALRTA
jgi:uncharacterized protein YndB with AHSA1/START domain